MTRVFLVYAIAIAAFVVAGVLLVAPWFGPVVLGLGVLNAIPAALIARKQR